jgi:hypothetical protein
VTVPLSPHEAAVSDLGLTRLKVELVGRLTGSGAVRRLADARSGPCCGSAPLSELFGWTVAASARFAPRRTAVAAESLASRDFAAMELRDVDSFVLHESPQALGLLDAEGAVTGPPSSEPLGHASSPSNAASAATAPEGGSSTVASGNAENDPQMSFSALPLLPDLPLLPFHSPPPLEANTTFVPASTPGSAATSAAAMRLLTCANRQSSLKMEHLSESRPQRASLSAGGSPSKRAVGTAISQPGTARSQPGTARSQPGTARSKRRASLLGRLRGIESDEGGPEDDSCCGPCPVTGDNIGCFDSTWHHWIATTIRMVVVAPLFEAFIVLCIIVSGAAVGVQLYPLANDPQAKAVFSILDTVVVTIFTLEMALKIIAEGKRPIEYFRSPANNLDAIIVILSLVPWSGSSSSSSGGAGTATVIRTVRLLRLLKLVKAVPPLRVLVLGVAESFSAISYIFGLLLLLVFCFGVAGNVLFAKSDPFNFDTLAQSMITVYRSGKTLRPQSYAHGAIGARSDFGGLERPAVSVCGGL